jgi:multidrug resistance protein
MSSEFGVSTATDNPELALPISVFLVGYIFGPLLFGPLSEELYGRRKVLRVAFAGYTVFTLACALAPNWPSLLVFRLFTGIFSSAPLTVGGGMVADVYNDPAIRGRVLTYFLAANICAPLFAPTISGYVSQVSWRWAFWIGLILAGATWIPLAFLPETYGPTILASRAQSHREYVSKTGQGNINTYAAMELEERGWRKLFGVVLTRPLRMFFTELIVTATSLYLAMAYGIYYMYFQTYPIVFKGIYHMAPGPMGLMYLPIGAGIVLGMLIFLWWDSYLQKSLRNGKPWAKKKEYRRLPLACFGGPLFVASLFWLGWTAHTDIQWVTPFLAGVPFGIANLLISIALLNYLSDAYGVFSASAMAASASSRSVVGAALPLAAAPMYAALGVGWATSVFGFLSLLMCAIPFVFIYYGDVIRERSSFYQRLKTTMEHN